MMVFYSFGPQVGSVDEESTKSDEEYDDLAMLDVNNGYWSDDDMEYMDRPGSSKGSSARAVDRYRQNLDLFLRSKSESSKSLCSYSSLMKEKGNIRTSGAMKMKKRSLSIPAMRKHGSAIDGPILSGAPQG